MKCTRCGAEVEAQKFCIYCGERLSGREMRVQRAPSGVMRFRHRSNISHSALPEVQNHRASGLQASNLSSLQKSSSHASDYIESVSSQRIPSMPHNRSTSNASIAHPNEPNSRQSRELESLLSKLNQSTTQSASIDQQLNLEDDLLDDVSAPSMENLCPEINDESLDAMERTYSDDDFNSFFEVDVSLSDAEDDVSSTHPVGSGSFARVPSGGFHLVMDSIKNVYQGMVKRLRALRQKNSTIATRRNQTTLSNHSNERARQIAKFSIIGAILLAIVAIVFTVATSAPKQPTEQPQLAAAPIAGNDTFAILPLEDPETFEDEVIAFDEDDFSIPELDSLEFGDLDQETQEIQPTIVATNDFEQQPTTATTRLTELRLYNHKDNVLSQATAGESYKIRNSCILRQGPASRFDLVKQIPSGTTIKVLAHVDEDWTLQSGGVWTKPGHASKLGPGDQFADALKGMTLPQPKSRVISAKNWRYIQFGEIYGYVGPACFK